MQPANFDLRGISASTSSVNCLEIRANHNLYSVVRGNFKFKFVDKIVSLQDIGH